jgi:hypothetical protein
MKPKEVTATAAKLGKGKIGRVNESELLSRLRKEKSLDGGDKDSDIGSRIREHICP